MMTPEERAKLAIAFDGYHIRPTDVPSIESRVAAQIRAAVEDATKKLTAENEALATGNLAAQHRAAKRNEALRERVKALERVREALEGIIDIGKRDTTNPKYNGYFDEAKEALAACEKFSRNEGS